MFGQRHTHILLYYFLMPVKLKFLVSIILLQLNKIGFYQSSNFQILHGSNAISPVFSPDTCIGQDPTHNSHATSILESIVCFIPPTFNRVKTVLTKLCTNQKFSCVRQDQD